MTKIDAQASAVQVSALVSGLRSNTDDFYADRISYEAFTARQRVAWDEIDAMGMVDQVAAALRDDLSR